MRAVSIGGRLQIVDGRPGVWKRVLGLTTRGVQKWEWQKRKQESRPAGSASNANMNATGGELFDEKYRVVAVESQCLIIRGVKSGKVLTIVNPDPETPLTATEYPPGKLIALTDPSASPLN
jgi:hypothetical protein